MDENEKKAYAIYEAQGQLGVLETVNQGILKVDFKALCEPCEYVSPIYNNCCLVCGTIFKMGGK
jgi:hypothetical protein